MSLTEIQFEHQLDPLSSSFGISVTDVLANVAFILIIPWVSSTSSLEMTFLAGNLVFSLFSPLVQQTREVCNKQRWASPIIKPMPTPTPITAMVGKRTTRKAAAAGDAVTDPSVTDGKPCGS